MNKPSLKQVLIAEIMRSKYNKYAERDLNLLDEFHLQQLLSSIILEGDKHVVQDLSEWSHIRNYN